MPCSLSPFVGTPLCALRTIASFCRTHVAAQLPGNRAVTPAQASGHFPAAQAHGHKYFDPDAFFQSKMAMGHGGLLLAEWLLVLPTLPESRLVLLTFHAPIQWCIWNENLPPLRKINLSSTGCYTRLNEIFLQLGILLLTSKVTQCQYHVDCMYLEFFHVYKSQFFIYYFLSKYLITYLLIQNYVIYTSGACE